MTKVTAWSYSRYAVHAMCPLKFKLQFIDKIPTPQSPAMARGNEMHVAIASHLTKGTPPPEVKFNSGIIAELNNFPDKEVEQQWGFNHNWKRCGWFGKDIWYRQICDVAVCYEDFTVEAVDWKGFVFGTPVPTPKGFVNVEDIQEGQMVFGTSGKPTKVIGRSRPRKLPCKTIHFKNNTPPITCDIEHRWVVRRASAGARHYAVTVRADELVRGDFICAAEPVHFAKSKKLPIHPYVLGAWLGDGKHTDGSICKPDVELFETIEKCGYEVGPPHGQRSDLSKCTTRTVYGLRTRLRLAGLLGSKHIPESYLRSSLSARQELVQGLMDTDGTWNKKRGRAGFCSVDEKMARDLASTIASLGEVPTVQVVKRFGFGKHVMCWEVWWSPTRFNPFLLPRKRDLVKLRGPSRRGYYISEVEDAPDAETVCLAVEAPNKQFLVGPHFVPTHNTGKRYGSNDEQMELQAVGIMQNFKASTHVTTRLVYLDTDHQEFAEYPREDLPKLIDKWEKKVAPMFSDTTYLPRPNDMCRFCHFSRSNEGQCRYG